MSLLWRTGVMLLACGGAVLLGWTGFERHIDMACETDEWPHLSACPDRDVATSEQVERLRTLIGRNPGDTANYVALALLAAGEGGVAPLDDQAVLDAARTLAPPNPLLQRALAARAVDREQWDEGVQALVRLVQTRRDAKAARDLAALLAGPDSREAVVAAVREDSRWVEPVLRALPAARVSTGDATPLLIAALSKQLLTPETTLAFINQLKGEKNWLDAQALWLRLLGRPTGMIYNGGFETGFLRGGFDWELPNGPPNRTGAEVQQPVVGGAQGRALELVFNGRPLALPAISQTLVLFPGTYAFSGRFMTRGLNAGAGLVWTFHCLNGGAELARTSPLRDTSGQWQELNARVDVPDGCGAVRLQLRTQLASDAYSGLRGDAYFDNLRLALP